MKEEWKYYKSFKCGRVKEPNREIWVSNYGRTMINGVINNHPTKAGKERIYVVVAQLFIPNPENKPQVDHIDTNRKNNRVDNLKWVTPKENMNNSLTKEHCKKAMYKRISKGVYAQVSQKLKGHTPWNKGLTHSTDNRIKCSFKISDEGKEKISKANSKEVIQYTLDGEFVRLWNSATEVKRELGYNNANITACCRGKYKTAYGFIWKYA